MGIYLVGISVEGDFLHTAHGSLRRGVAQEKTTGVDRKIRCMLRRIVERRSATDRPPLIASSIESVRLLQRRCVQRASV